ncbi:hypothetical protein PSTG_17217 [Puccinia striiformis f. sp. tritici PST-78]|uniref:Uncharacterized protein n=1 Tax=Puccinia striiformis f. sp. tritici PST-78 TaxID=1165861 RepID=A0A0L0URC9_9BASI|nr:hypothetical protein PSTG_17217 [Puccinia striiformis f. sp. tritici PST-78]
MSGSQLSTATDPKSNFTNNLHKALHNHEVKVEAGFLQVYNWQNSHVNELEGWKAEFLERVDGAILKIDQLRKDQQQLSDQFDDQLVENGLVNQNGASAQSFQEDVKKKLVTLCADVNHLKSNMVLDNQVSLISPSVSPEQSVAYIIQHQRFRQELQNLITQHSGNVTSKLEESLEDFKSKLYATERSMNVFQQTDYPKETKAVKDGLYKVVNDLKDVLGPRRPQTISEELGFIASQIDALSSKIESVESSVSQLSLDFLAIKNDPSAEHVSESIEQHTDWFSKQAAHLHTKVFQEVGSRIREEARLAVANELDEKDLINSIRSSVEQEVKSKVAHEVKSKVAHEVGAADIIPAVKSALVNEIKSHIDGTAKLAAEEVAALALKSKADFLSQAEEEFSKLGTRSRWDELSQNLADMKSSSLVNMANYESLMGQMKEVKSTLEHHETEIMCSQAQSRNINKDTCDKDVVQSQNPSDLMESQINLRIQIELANMKDHFEAMISDKLKTSQVRFDESCETFNHLDPSLRPPSKKKGCFKPNTLSQAFIDSSTDMMDIASSDEEQKDRFHPDYHSQAFMNSSTKTDMMEIVSSDEEMETAFQSQLSRRSKAQYARPWPPPRNDHTPEVPEESPCHSPPLYNRETNFHPYRNIQKNRHPSSKDQPAASSSRKGKYSNPAKARKQSEGIRTSSVRKDRDIMDATEKDIDQNLSLALQYHVRILSSTRRSKDDLLPLVTEQDLESLPNLNTNFCDLPLPPSAPYLLTKDDVSLRISDDTDMKVGFVRFCEQKARTYGLPYVGLAIEDGSKACDWNRRTEFFLLDTLLHAMSFGHYPEYFVGESGPDPARLQKLLNAHLKYCLELIERRSADNEYIKWERKRDRVSKRCKRLAGRRYGTCGVIPELSPYAILFEDERLCSSDESMDDPMDEDKVRHTPPWRSQLATLLVNFIDAVYIKLRSMEYPQKPGRKPSKRLVPKGDPIISNSTSWPIKLPDDCYAQSWLQDLEPHKKNSLKAPAPALGDLIRITQQPLTMPQQ